VHRLWQVLKEVISREWEIDYLKRALKKFGMPYEDL